MMELLSLVLVIILFVLFLIPNNVEEEKDNSYYKLTHCDIHQWISKSTGFDGVEFSDKYTICSVCKFNPETGKYE